MKKKVRIEDVDVIVKGVNSKLPIGAKMALIQPTEEWARTIQAMSQALTGKSLEELKKELGNPCAKERGEVQKCEDCDHYKTIVNCSMRQFKDEKTGEIKQCSAPCDYMFDSGDICVNCPSAQYLFLGIDCPCPAPGIYRHGEPEDEEFDDYGEDEEAYY